MILIGIMFNEQIQVKCLLMSASAYENIVIFSKENDIWNIYKVFYNIAIAATADKCVISISLESCQWVKKNVI